MKMITKTLVRFLALVALLSILNLQLSSLLAQGTAFTYQGRLTEGGSSASGRYDLQCTLYDSATAGNQVGGILTNTATPVSDGLFTVVLDFGPVFTGPLFWLQIGVRTNGLAGLGFTPLSPRQPLTPTPYATMAHSASNLLGLLPASRLTATVPDARLSSNVARLDATQAFSGTNGFLANVGIGTLHPNQALQIAGPENTAIDLGTGPLTLRSSVNSAAGASFGTVSSHDLTLFTGNLPREIIKADGKVGIGKTSPASALDVNGTVTATGFQGNGASLSNVNAAKLGGLAPANFWSATGNAGTAVTANFIGTTDNQALELKVNGARALRLEPNSAGAPNLIGGSALNSVSVGVLGASIGGGGAANYLGLSFTNKVTGDFGTVGGGLGNAALGDSATVGGGRLNTADGGRATVGGGEGNSSQTGSSWATLGGGRLNQIGPGISSSTIAGGEKNFIGNGASWSAIPGGILNEANAPSTFAAGTQAKANHQGAFVWADSTGSALTSTANDQFMVRATGGAQFHTLWGTVLTSAGAFNAPQLLLQQENTNDYARLRLQAGGPAWDIALAPGPQPALNFWNGSADVLSLAQNGDATLAGNLKFGTGALRQMLDLWAGEHGIGVQGWTTYFRTIGGGANGGFAFYKGGVHADGQFDPGGGQELMRLTAGGLNPAVDLNFPQSYPRQFINFATSKAGSVAGIGQKGLAGEIFFRTGSDFLWYMNGALNNVAGNAGPGGSRLMWLSQNGLSVEGWVSATNFFTTSDRNAKENFKPVQPAEVLAKVAALPISEWQFKTDPSMRHIGPMAQDFYAAFQVGPDDKHIATVDADGVALAAIQGLNQKVESENAALRAALQDKDTRLQSLQQRLEALEEKLSRR